MNLVLPVTSSNESKQMYFSSLAMRMEFFIVAGTRI